MKQAITVEPDPVHLMSPESSDLLTSEEFGDLDRLQDSGAMATGRC
jgi:hypothetical protein